MDANVRMSDPREHINEEPRNDLQDLIYGTTGMLIFMAVIFFGMVIVKYIVG